MSKAALFAVVVIGVLGLVYISALITIWSLNLLFHTNIQYDIFSVLAAMWLTTMVGSRSVNSIRK